MKKAISLVLLILIIFSISVLAVSCGDDPEQPIEVEKNPPSDKNNNTQNTWDDGNALGKPVQISPS